MLNRFLISPPFGNYLSFDGFTSVMGTFTPNPRRGLIWRTAKTLRPVEGGWVNAIGLRNNGIKSAPFTRPGMFSVNGLNKRGWEDVILQLFYNRQHVTHVELNLSCPNVEDEEINQQALEEVCKAFDVSVKLPPTGYAFATADRAVSAGVKYLHLSNTLPTPRGGVSGKSLKDVNLKLVDMMHERYDTPIIAGGGIYTIADVWDYQRVGASHFSLATVFLYPFQARRLLREIANANL